MPGRSAEVDGRSEAAVDPASALSPSDVTAARRLLPPVPSSAGLDRIAALAAQVLRAPAAQISLLTDVDTVVGVAGAAALQLGDTAALDVSLAAVVAGTRATLVVPDTSVRDLPGVATGPVQAVLGVPLTTDRGETVGALCVLDTAPREWSDADAGLLEQLAPSVLAELELAALGRKYQAAHEQWTLALDAAGIGGFDWDLTTGDLQWDERLIALFGYDDDGFDGSIEAFNARVHPDDLPRVTASLQRAIDTCGSYQAEYRVVRPDRGTRWVQARGHALCDENGTSVRLLGAAYDTTAVREGEARVARVLESMSAAFFALDTDWRFTYVNGEAERVLGRRRDELIGGVIWELFPAAVGSDFERHYRGAVESGQPTSFEAYYPPPLDSWYEVRAWPAPDGLSVYFLDITGRRDAMNRASLLSSVTSELTETLNLEEGVGRLARLVVPALADWCLVSLVDDDSTTDWRRAVRDVGIWHVDPETLPLLERYSARRMEAADLPFLVATLRDQRPMVIRDAAESIAGALGPGPAAELIRRLAPQSVLLQPIRARGRTLGLLMVAWSGRPEPRREDLEVAAEIADRAGLALDNARLYRQQRVLAEGLQRSLLTAPPEPDHMEIVVRYEPAAAAAQVGGDWYDAFLQRNGSTVLVIGDVVGHDVDAAAAMGQIRGLLRGIAARTGDTPADVLCGLDETMDLLQVETTATAVVTRFEQTADEHARGITRMRWSNAGHPPPVVINPDGSVFVLGGVAGVDSDLLLGIDPQTRRTESQVTLDRGATVLLYTDGLVERRGQALDEGLAKLRAALLELADCELDELCDRLLRRMLPARAEDDVALAAVRLHRQDQPRPAEAGPNRRVPDVVAAPGES